MSVETNDEMLKACQKSLAGNSALVMLASVLDFVPRKNYQANSVQVKNLKLTLKRQIKLLPNYNLVLD